MALNLRERCTKRLAGLKAIRGPWEAEWREIASQTQPWRSRFLATNAANDTPRRNTRINSGHGIFAFRTLQGGMTSGLSSPSRPWFTLASYDEATNDDPEMREYLAAVEKALYAFLAGTNFYSAVKTGYLELGLFGTEACIMLEHPREGAVCHQLTAGEYWIGLGSSLTPEALYRRCPLTTIQVMQYADSGFFRKDRIHHRIKKAYDDGNYETIHNFYQAIEINDERDSEKWDARGKMWRSAYWDENDERKDGDGCVKIGGYEEQPFWAPRWDTAGADVYGTGPGSDALPDLRELWLQTKRKAEATDFLLKPEVIAPARLKLRRIPGSVVSAAVTDIEKVFVPYTVPYQAIDAILGDIQRCETAIDRASYAELFMAITMMEGSNYKNIEEIVARNEEKLTQLGPVIERVNNEKLEVVVDRGVGIMDRAGLLPPPPARLAEIGGELKTEFVSILTQMQRMVGLGQIERMTGYVGNLVGVAPDALDVLDTDEAVREYASRAGAPPKMIRSVKDVEAIRANRADQQNVERMIAAAPAAKDGAQAAKVMTEVAAGLTPASGAPLPI